MPARLHTLAGLTLYRRLLPRRKVILSNRPRRTAVHPPCDMPRSERCRIRGNCLDGIALPSLAQAPVAGGAPAAGRAAPASGGSSGRSEPSNGLEPFRRPLAGLGERSKAVSEALRTVARAWASGKAEHGRRSGPGRQRASWGLGGPRGPSSQARAHGGRWIGFGGSLELEVAWSRLKASLARPRCFCDWHGRGGRAKPS